MVSSLWLPFPLTGFLNAENVLIHLSLIKIISRHSDGHGTVRYAQTDLAVHQNEL